MSKRIDHAAEAQICIDWAHRQPVSDPEAQFSMAQAQVHATLALMEQQRIANQIAYLSADVVGGGAGSAGAIQDIERGLGL